MKICNPKLAFRDTHRYGVGVFALAPIAKNEVVVVFSGPEVPADTVPLYPEYDCYMQVAPGKYIGPSGYEDDVINHSCEPNCKLDLSTLQLRALRNIVAGEEVTYDYADVIFSDDEWCIPCKCGSPTCRQFIRSLRSRLL